MHVVDVVLNIFVLLRVARFGQCTQSSASKVAKWVFLKNFPQHGLIEEPWRPLLIQSLIQLRLEILKMLLVNGLLVKRLLELLLLT